MYAMSYTVANAVSNALSFKAWQPEEVLGMALRLVPDLDNVALHMIIRYIEEDECRFDCIYSQRKCEPILDQLQEAIQAELERRREIARKCSV